MDTIDFGDKVQHRTNNKFNAFLMTVLEVEDDKVVCEYTDAQTHELKKGEFTKGELQVMQKAEGGFF